MYRGHTSGLYPNLDRGRFYSEAMDMDQNTKPEVRKAILAMQKEVLAEKQRNFGGGVDKLQKSVILSLL